MTDYEKSAIIGYWRSGATVMEIYYLTGITPDKIKKLTTDYVSTIHEKEQVGGKGKELRRM